LAAALLASIAAVSMQRAAAATNQYEGCLAYDKPVTLTGTVLLRKIVYQKKMTRRPRVALRSPCLSLINQFALRQDQMRT